MKTEIRKWEMSDAKELAALLSNKNILNNLRDGLPYPYTVKDAEEYISAMTSADTNTAFAVTCDDKVVGSIAAFRQENIHSLTAELGYYLAEEYWNKGICTEAVKLITKYIFKNTNTIRTIRMPRFPLTAE